MDAWDEEFKVRSFIQVKKKPKTTLTGGTFYISSRSVRAEAIHPRASSQTERQEALLSSGARFSLDWWRMLLGRRDKGEIRNQADPQCPFQQESLDVLEDSTFLWGNLLLGSTVLKVYSSFL